MSARVLLLSRPVSVASIPSAGIERTFAASQAERLAVAEVFGLLEVKSLDSTLIVSSSGRGRVRVEGRVKAEIVQACVVTLDPVPQSIDEPVDVRFAPADSEGLQRPAGEVADPLAVDPPDPLPGDAIDLGAIALEHFVLAIDPYPRAPGAELPPEAADSDAEADSPFAVLAGLVGKPDKRG